VTIAGRDIVIHENESVYVPKSTLHRLENPYEAPLEIIEVQNGEYIGEDDIVRFDDMYGR
jgi:mannose-1-phosphate guanylyltransferase/mannose-6-phosphate isomerase